MHSTLNFAPMKSKVAPIVQLSYEKGKQTRRIAKTLNFSNLSLRNRTTETILLLQSMSKVGSEPWSENR